MSDRHREALAHLLYGIQGDGAFILLSGEVGTGKTTICRCLLEQIPSQVDTAFILNPKLTAAEMLAAACDDLKIEYPKDATIKVLTDCINSYLLNAHAKDRRTVLIIDEAQNLSIEVLEQLRLLTNLETNQRKLLQIILLGQPELLTLLAQPELRQLSQRITARFHLEALSREEISAYIKHRLAVAGAKGSFFSKQSVNRIFKISQGIPRITNLICDRSLLGAYSEGELQVTPKIVAKAATEILGDQRSPQYNWKALALISIAGFILIAAALIGLLINPAKPTFAVAPAAETISEDNSTASGQDSLSGPAEVSTVPLSEKSQSTIIADTVDVSPSNPGALNPSADLQTSSARISPLALTQGHERAGVALRDLLGLWKVDFTDPDSATCELSETIGLFCFSSTAGLNEIKEFDRPVVINLNNQWFTLQQLSRTTARLRVGELTHEIAISELLEAWSGNFTLLWRAPPGYRAPLAPGDQGPAVAWLKNRLMVINNQPQTTSPGYIFDARLESEVRQFQLISGLNPDGIAGVKTWIKINDADDIETPRLNGAIL